MSEHPERPYIRPVVCGPGGPGAEPLAGGLIAFAEVEVLHRGRAPERLPTAAVEALYPETAGPLGRLRTARTPLCGLAMDRPKIMGVVNVTPDSFSDGGRLGSAEAAVGHGMALIAAGADLLDIGGESTRPGADPVSADEELARVIPVLEGLAAAGAGVPLSIDTRKARVAEVARRAGASLFNDVSALEHDPASADVAAGFPALCLMHALGDPKSMQDDPRYGDVLLDVYDYLERRIAMAERAGVPRARIAVDPGIGFGKTLAHNLALIRGLALFHGLGCPLLLGVSRKGFIGALTGETEAARRAPGSIAAGLAGLALGVQILRVHDVAETVQAVRVWQALAERPAAG